jgi:hypothetical protein
MKRISGILVVQIVLFFNVSAQQLYFVSGHPFRNIEDQFPAIIYQYNQDSLISRLYLSNEDLLLEFVKVYNELNLLVALTSEYKTKEDREILSVVYTNKPDSVYNVSIDLSDKMRCHITNLINSSYGLMQCFDCLDKNNKQKPMKERIVKEFCWDLKDLSQHELTPEDYKNTIIVGSPASAIEGWDYLNLYSNPYDGRLFIPVTPDTTKRPVFPYILPDSLQLKKKKLLALLVNNNACAVIVVDRIASSNTELGASILYIYNKINNKWFRFKIKGNNDSMRGYKNWIAGTVVSNNVKLIFNDKGQLKEKINFNRVSPGIEKRRQKGTKYGTFFDMRANFYDYYFPGILYLLDVNTLKYIEWETGQGDSEILLVQQDIVYYRINDEIYKAPIINNEKLGKPILLVKDKEIVPDIHWAFISEE